MPTKQLDKWQLRKGGFMVYVTTGYLMKQFETQEDAEKYIKDSMDQAGLNYKLVFVEKRENVEVRIYQYWTLYKEVYIIHKEIDLRR